MMDRSKQEPSTDIELDYLTIIPLYSGSKYIRIYPYRYENYGSGKHTQLAPFWYRMGNGDWMEVNLSPSYSMYYDITLRSTSILQLKSVASEEFYEYPDFSTFRIESSSRHAVAGTPMSLLYGDDFTNHDSTLYDLGIAVFYNDSGLEMVLNTKTFLPFKLTEVCYDSMFNGCSNLTLAPELPARVLEPFCYFDMFKGCEKLNYIKMLATDISADACLSEWVSGVASTGTFVKSKDATWDVSGDSGVPTGWTVITDEDSEGEMGFLIQEGAGSTLKNTAYKAMYGMTWRQWIGSEYNVNSYIIEGEMVLTNDGMFSVADKSGSRICLEDIIQPAVTYYLS